MKRIAMIAALLMAACQPVPEKGDLGYGNEPAPVAVPESAAAADCIARNGTMQPVGRMQTMQCVVRYADAGKRCTDSDQCAGSAARPMSRRVRRRARRWPASVRPTATGSAVSPASRTARRKPRFASTDPASEARAATFLTP
jgi:hypothetical protein